MDKDEVRNVIDVYLRAWTAQDGRGPDRMPRQPLTDRIGARRVAD